MRNLYVTTVALSALLAAVPVMAQTAPSVTDARLTAIEARLAVLEAKSAGASASPTPAPSTVTPPADKSGTAKMVQGMSVSVHPIDKDLNVTDVEVGKFDMAAGSWPAKLTAHQAHGVNYQQPNAYVIDATYHAETEGAYLIGLEVERTGAGSGKCQTSVVLKDEQITSDLTGNLYSSASRGQPFQRLVSVTLDGAGDYPVRFIVSCTDSLFVWTPMIKSPSDNSPHGFRADELKHKPIGGNSVAVSAKK